VGLNGKKRIERKGRGEGEGNGGGMGGLRMIIWLFRKSWRRGYT